MALIFGAVEVWIQSLETIWRSFQRPPARTSWPIFAMSRGRKRTPPAGIAVSFDPNPLDAGNAQGLEQGLARKFVEGASGSLADYGRHKRQRAGVVEILLSWRGRRRKTEDVTTRIGRHMHAHLIVVVLVARDGLDPLQTHRHCERVNQLDAVLLRGTQVGQLGEEAEDRFVDAAYRRQR